MLSSGRRGDHSLAANTAYLTNVSASTEGFVGLTAQHHHHRHQSLHGLLTAAAASAAAGSAAAAAASAAAASLDSPRSSAGDELQQQPDLAITAVTHHPHNTIPSAVPSSSSDTDEIANAVSQDAIDAAVRMQPTLPTQTNAGSADMDLPAVQSMDWLFKKDKLLMLTQFWQQVSASYEVQSTYKGIIFCLIIIIINQQQMLLVMFLILLGNSKVQNI